MKPKKTMARRCQFCQGMQPIIEDPRKCTCLSRSRNHHSVQSYRRKQISSSLLTNQSRQLPGQSQLSVQLHQLTNDNEYLRSQNSRLKRQYQSHYPTANETLLQERLYQANKSLQQAILNLDIASRANKELQEKLTTEKYALDQVRLERDGLFEQIDRYKAKLRKCMGMMRGEEDGLGDRYADVKRLNGELQARNQQLMDELAAIRSSIGMRSESGWVRKTAKKINCIEQNITKIQENHQEIAEMKEQIESMHNQYKEKITIVMSCQQHIELQMANAIKYSFPNISTPSFNLQQLNRVSNMFAPGDLRDIIQKLDISGYLSKLLGGIAQAAISTFSALQHQIENRFRKLEAKTKTTERRLINLTKLLNNNRMKSKTERTRLRHLSNKTSIEVNKENINTMNTSSNMRWINPASKSP